MTNIKEIDSQSKQTSTYQDDDFLKIKVDRLNVIFENKKLIDNVSFNVEKNKILSIIGPSGCGKSTILRSINRMHEISKSFKIEGDILFDGKSVFDYNPMNLRYKIGMIFQKPTTFPISIFENVAFGPRIHGIKNRQVIEQIVKEALQQAALWDEVKDSLKKPAHQLSGGQQQRLCIARALALKPEVILMDEPTSSLDPIATSKIEELCLKLKKNYTIILVTHSMNQAKKISDKTVFILDGKLIEVDYTKNLFSRPKHWLTEKYITGRYDKLVDKI
ncbi:phosphate ABC transporter ATP-binding protein PstB [Mycoplasma sp. SG1]|uniref:phosphate ABC transporter ATP-binding protein PstB n=1 Tax=Mycoplasma sp. SG1 TaxID=2810348 RepID=UPI0020258ADA|nr:phosphate ABC transporter ATP-binding protein PstB [Mycoplasma sp. SG1]